MVKDSISNLIIKLKNASLALKTEVSFPYSKMVVSILEVLKNNNFIDSFDVLEDKGKKNLKIKLLTEKDGSPRITGVERVSKQSKRIYGGVKSVKPIKNNFGLLVLSTSKGIMGGYDAKKQKIGGEFLFKIW